MSFLMTFPELRQNITSIMAQALSRLLECETLGDVETWLDGDVNYLIQKEIGKFEYDSKHK